MHVTGLTGLQHLSFAYFVINVDPVLLHLGPIVVHWYGLMYVVAISIGLWVITRWARDLGIHDDQIWGLFIWTAIAGLIGGRLYFVVQQPDLVQTYLLQPANIFKVWNGGMAFFGAIFCGTAALYFLAPRYGLSRWIAIDGGALFAAVGQIFGRVGNIINGDIVGQAASSGIVAVPGTVCSHAPCVAFVPDANILGWAVVYLNSGSFTRTGIAYQPAPIYEIGLNLIALAILWPLRYRLPRIKAGMFFVVYLALYAASQLIVFFARGSEPITPFLGVTIFKQAQWTAIFVLLACIPLALFVRRTAEPWPYSSDNPVPWPPAPADAAATPGSRPRAQGHLPARSDVPEGATNAAVAVEPPSWQPTRPSFGRLRNVFGTRQPPHDSLGS
jgi:phosphatidylglycerol---prolipoprotein diacylglyceryl transferase